MTRNRRRIVVVAGLGTLVSFALGTALGSASGPDLPADFDAKGSPVWVDADGSVHPERIPVLTPVVDADGNPVGFARREDLYPELFTDGSGRGELDDTARPPGNLPVYDEAGERVGWFPDGETFQADE